MLRKVRFTYNNRIRKKESWFISVFFIGSLYRWKSETYSIMLRCGNDHECAICECCEPFSKKYDVKSTFFFWNRGRKRIVSDMTLYRMLKPIPLRIELKVVIKALYANVLLHRFAKFYGLEKPIRKQEMLTAFFSLFAVCTIESRKPVALCLDLEKILNALYANVPNRFVRWRKIDLFWVGAENEPCDMTLYRMMKRIPLCLEVKIFMNALYANVLLHRFSKFYGL